MALVEVQQQRGALGDALDPVYRAVCEGVEAGRHRAPLAHPLVMPPGDQRVARVAGEHDDPFPDQQVLVQQPRRSQPVLEHVGVLVDEHQWRYAAPGGEELEVEGLAVLLGEVPRQEVAQPGAPGLREAQDHRAGRGDLPADQRGVPT